MSETGTDFEHFGLRELLPSSLKWYFVSEIVFAELSEMDLYFGYFCIKFDH